MAALQNVKVFYFTSFGTNCRYALPLRHGSFNILSVLFL